LHIVKDSFIDPDLREHFSDLLYRTRLQDGRDAYVYVLFEHKSHPEPLIALQLLRYMVRIWEQVLKQGKPTHLPIVPVVVYHGVENWRIDVRFQNLFVDQPALAAYTPDFRYQLCDLSDYGDEGIAGEVLLKVTLLILKHVFDGELSERLPGILSLSRELAQARSGLEYLEVVLRYLTVAADQLSDEDLRHAVEEAFPPTGGALMATMHRNGLSKVSSKVSCRTRVRRYSTFCKFALTQYHRIRRRPLPRLMIRCG
jgi:predicted transposase/invertase (TIGR01784 family)